MQKEYHEWEKIRKKMSASVCNRVTNDWNIQQLAAKINQSARTERKGTNTIDSPPTSAPLLSFFIQDPWALCQLGILRTHSKKAKERGLFKTRTHSLTVSCFSLHFPREEGFLVAAVSLHLRRGGGGWRRWVGWREGRAPKLPFM